MSRRGQGGGRSSRRLPGSVLPAFVPTKIAGLSLWLRADLGITVTGSGVSTWADQSGGGRNVTQGTDAKRPPWANNTGPNNTAGLTFSGTQFLQNAGSNMGTGSQNWTWFVVFNVGSTAFGQNIVINGNRALDGWGATVAETAATKREVLACAIAFDVGAGAASTSFEAWTIQDTAGTQSMRVNGSSVALVPNNTAPNAPTATMTVGMATDGITNPLVGVVSEIIAYNAVLTAGQITQVENYIRSRTAIW